VPTTAPAVSTSPGNQQVGLSWNAVAGATSYSVFRTEGVFGCDFGKVRLGDTAGTSWNDSGLQNGRDYSYVVIPKTANDACFGPASACDTVQPEAGPECAVDADCDDGLFCNGVETCNAGSCVAGSDPCPGQGCDESGDVCTDTNGPSTKVYMDERGFLNERLPGDPLYWDATDPRPWGTFMDTSEERYKRYRDSLETEDN